MPRNSFPLSALGKAKTVVIKAIEDFSNRYYSTIPHEFGRNRPPAIDNNEVLRKEISMLDTLTDMEVANTIMKSTSDKDKDAGSINMLDKRFEELGMDEIEPLDHSSLEYRALADYLVKSSGTSHGIRYRLEDIFRIERRGEADSFAKSEFSRLKKHDRRLLWHGSRTTNYGGILSQGLRIAPPEAPVTGYAFGKVCANKIQLAIIACTTIVGVDVDYVGHLSRGRVQQVRTVLFPRHER